MLSELRDQFAYNHWANERVLTACEALSAPDLARDLGGSFPSVWATVSHIYAAENTWLARWQGTPGGCPPDLDGVNDIAGLRDKWRGLWERQSRWIAGATDADVRRTIPIRFATDRRSSSSSARRCVTA